MSNFLEDYVDTLYERQNIGALEEQKNLYSKKDYYQILKPVIEVLKNNPCGDMKELRDELWKNSHIEEGLRDYFIHKKSVSGAVFSYGTLNFEETVIVGNQEELRVENGKIIPSVKEMRQDTIFDLASVTKIFTSLSIMKLLENGLIDLNDEIIKYESRFKNLEGVTIYDLLSFNVPLKTSKRIDSVDTKIEAEEILFNIMVDHDSKNMNPYTDMGVMILKYIIEKASGTNYFDFLSNTILKKYGMDDTSYMVPSYKVNRVVSNNFDSKVIKGGLIITNEKNYPGVVYDRKSQILGQSNNELTGHAGLFSSSVDMTNLLKGIIRKDVLGDRLFDEFVKNRQGRSYINDDGVKKYVQYLGYMTYSKHPIHSYSEVFHALSGKSFAGAGWTGTQITVDPINELYFFLGSNRAHNRITFIDKSEESRIVSNENGKGIIMPDGSFKIDARDFAYRRDEIIVHPIMKLLLQYKMLEDMMKYHKDKQDSNIRTVK